jgi:hypothetical protein
LFQLKERILEAFESIMKDEEQVVWIKAKDLVLQVIQAFVSNCIESQDTLKLTSSEEGSCKPADQSGSTEKLSSEDVPDGKFAYPLFCHIFYFFVWCVFSFISLVHVHVDDDDSVRNKRRCTTLLGNSQKTGHSYIETSNKIKVSCI